MKIVVFDLDETLGYFTEYGIFWDCLSRYIKIQKKNDLTQLEFNNILDIYPEFVRPNIINILKYLKTQKKKILCNKVMIYTNNQAPRKWAHNIRSYFESKIRCNLFDQVIAAFKVNGQLLEICRTTHDKTHKDLIKCTKVSENTEICFLDDSFYPEMQHDNIYYINVKPYFYDLKMEEMLIRFKKTELFKTMIENEKDFNEFMIKEWSKYNYGYIEKNKDEYDIDIILGKKILQHLKVFFYNSNSKKTHKTKINKNNKTKKIKK
jgi:hypothetical protein